MRIKKALKRFAYETFRPHSREEYVELFTRGDGEGVAPYPWFYARVFLVCLLLFGIMCIGYSLSGLDFLLVAFAGGIFADLTFVVLLAEIYPKRDLSLLAVLAAMLCGGVLSSALSYIGYAFRTYTPFAEQAWTAFVEETGKDLVTIIVLLIVGKRDPLRCLIFGAAVGGGYSAFENAWFMYTNGFYASGSAGLSMAVQTGLWRSLGTPFSHAAWAGIFGWALSGEKPYKTFRPYAMYAFGYTMHFFVNFPLTPMFSGWKGYPISAVTGVLSVALLIFLTIKSFRAVRPLPSADVSEDAEAAPQTEDRLISENGEISLHFASGASFRRSGDACTGYRLMSNVLLSAAALCVFFAMIGPTCVFGGYRNYSYRDYSCWEEALADVQNGHVFDYDEERPYLEQDPSLNKSYVFEDGKITSVTQAQTYGDYEYFFTYVLVPEEVTGSTASGALPREEQSDESDTAYRWEITSVSVDVNGAKYYRQAAHRVNYETASDGSVIGIYDPRPYYYFQLNSRILSITGTDGERFTAIVSGTTPVRLTESIVFTSVFSAAAVACGVGYAVYKLKIRRIKKCSTKNVSSVK